MSFTDTGFVVRLLSEEDQSYFTIRLLELQNTKVSMQGCLLVNSISLEFQHGFKHCLTSLLPFKYNSMQLKKDCDFRVCNVFLVTNQLSHAELCLYNAPVLTKHYAYHRQRSRERSITFTTPHGLTSVFQNPLPPSSTSSSRFGSLARWTRSMGPQWCTAALGLVAQGPLPWWIPVQFW